MYLFQLFDSMGFVTFNFIRVDSGRNLVNSGRDVASASGHPSTGSARSSSRQSACRQNSWCSRCSPGLRSSRFGALHDMPEERCGIPFFPGTAVECEEFHGLILGDTGQIPKIGR
jgi:hypothetical protein